MIVIDTSVLVSALQPTQTHHRASREFARSFSREHCAVSNHALAELYATVTALPHLLRLSPAEAMVAIKGYLKCLTPVSLSSEEYLDALHRVAQLGRISGAVYDALHLACARKINAERIYTWNLKHFRALAPDLASRIQTP